MWSCTLEEFDSTCSWERYKDKASKAGSTASNNPACVWGSDLNIGMWGSGCGSGVCVAVWKCESDVGGSVGFACSGGDCGVGAMDRVGGYVLALLAGCAALPVSAPASL